MTEHRVGPNGSVTNKNGCIKNGKSADTDTDWNRNIERRLRFGYGKYRPNWMQVFNSPKFLCALLSAMAFIQSFVVNGINNVNVTSYERRFGLPSSRVGIISSSYDISAGILVLPITYLALSAHKHLMLAAAVGVMGLGSFLMSLPHFTTGNYEWGDGSATVCSSGNATTCVQSNNADLSYYLYVLVAGQLLHGIGGTTFYGVGLSCMDDCVSTKNSPVYVGILYSFSAFGPAVGYLLGGYLVDIYVDFNIVESVPLTTTDPRWVGAWWIGFLISMSMAFVLTFLMLGLPRELPGTREIRASRVSEAYKDRSDGKVPGSSFKELPRVTWMLLKNPIFMLIALAGSSENLVVSGFSTFTAKFIQNQFGQTAGFSAILMGCMAVPGATGGFLLGGFLCRKFQFTVRGNLRLCAFVSLVSMFAAATMWLRCGETKIAGVNASYNNSHIAPATPDLVSSCNVDCQCSQESYTPVCGANGVQYFSPCHAGCSESIEGAYHSCSCFNSTASYNQTAVEGVCDTDCPLLYVFLPLFFIVMVLTFVSATPITMTTLRCVPLSHKTFAVGVMWVFVRFLGTVPGPIFFGVIIDSACVIWKHGCGSSANESCWIYDNEAMGRNFFLVALGVKTVSTLLFTLASLLYKPPTTVKDNNVEIATVEANMCNTKDSKAGDVTEIYRKFDPDKCGIDNPALDI